MNNIYQVYNDLNQEQKIFINHVALFPDIVSTFVFTTAFDKFIQKMELTTQSASNYEKNNQTYFGNQVTSARVQRIKKELITLGFLDRKNDKLHADLIHECLKLTIKEPYLDSLLKHLLQEFYILRNNYETSYLRSVLMIYKNEEKSFTEMYNDPAHSMILAIFFNLLQFDFDQTWFDSRCPAIKTALGMVYIWHYLATGSKPNGFAYIIQNLLSLKEIKKLKLSRVNLQIGFYNILQAQHMIKDETTLLARISQMTQQNAEEILVDILSFMFCAQSPKDHYLLFEAYIKDFKKIFKPKPFKLPLDEANYIYVLSLLRQNNSTAHKAIENFTKNWLMPASYDVVMETLLNVSFYVQGLRSKVKFSEVQLTMLGPVPLVVMLLCYYWIDVERLKVKDCLSYFEEYKDDLPLVSKIICDIILKLDPNNKACLEYVNNPIFSDMIDMTTIVNIKEGWQMALDNLDMFFGGTTPEKEVTEEKTRRIVWYYNLKKREITDILEQSLTKTKWSKGKQLTLKKLCEVDSVAFASPEDRRLIKAIKKEKYWGNNYTYQWDIIQMQLALVGHPTVYDALKPTELLHITSSKPELLIKQVDDNYFHLSLSHESDIETIFTEHEGKNNIRFIHFEKNFLPLTEILGKKGIKVPAKAKDHIINIVQKAGLLLPIHSDVEDIDIKAQDADSIPYIHLEPRGDQYGLFVQLLIRPFGDKGPYYKPAHGRPNIQMIDNMQPIKAKRDFKLEIKNANHILNSCKSLKQTDDGSYEWELEDPYECLETLADLKEYEEHFRTEDDLPKLRIEWPKGRKINLSEPVDFKKLRLNIQQSRDWFHVDGTVEIDKDTVLGLKQVLALLDQSKGRFIQLDENRYVALTNSLKKQLQELKYLGEEAKGGGFNIHSLGAQSLQTFAEQIDHLEVDQSWKKRVEKLKTAEDFTPVLPNNLQAELRDYQLEGFEWMARLSNLEMGACLADDMGLGKTVQAISMILTQAPKGPCLVVAPTSVCHNWHAEIKKFAPCLNTVSFDLSDRKKVIDELSCMDILICSYTLLQQEIENLASKEFAMVTLDEAQAIKNATTKRFQAAIKLNGHFKLALSGTPIENSLEELWSLFRFIAPGLLGSRESFSKRFLSPLEKDKEQARRQALKHLIKAFILRRTKATVLDELPPKTEQTILIDMEAEEKSFYEAIRQSAIENLSNINQTAGGNRKIHILAELTRLRRACCHPKLIDDNISIPSSKMRVFLKIVEELIQNNHKALVFSQYVGYLDLVRQELDSKNISYQYLDGSTPAADRQKRVQDFQQGQSSIFLLSLKAGGSGLNLTAADFVIHLDPWWNPAVEDQASDRAHRMGQTRPVTIYRLVMRQSIEERIIALHHDKRELADELLDGSASPHKLSESDLMNLLSSSFY